MEGSTEKPFAIIRDIRLSNIKVQCNSLGEIAGNPADTVSDIVFSNIDARALAAELKTNYTSIKFDNVIVNGKMFIKN
jgi:hypothetical protein